MFQKRGSLYHFTTVVQEQFSSQSIPFQSANNDFWTKKNTQNPFTNEKMLRVRYDWWKRGVACYWQSRFSGTVFKIDCLQSKTSDSSARFSLLLLKFSWFKEIDSGKWQSLASYWFQTSVLKSWLTLTVCVTKFGSNTSRSPTEYPKVNLVLSGAMHTQTSDLWHSACNCSISRAPYLMSGHWWRLDGLSSRIPSELWWKLIISQFWEINGRNRSQIIRLT